MTPTPHAVGSQENGTQNFFVLTGGPGSGKSTLMDALQRAGHARSIEAGRSIIRDQLAIGGKALPWADPDAFAELMLSWEMRSYNVAKQSARPEAAVRAP